MKICPKCKNEYRDGITHCADCGCELQDEIKVNTEHKLLLEAAYPLIKEAMEYLEYCKFKTVNMDEPDENGMVRMYCEKKEFGEASKQIQAFSHVKMQDALQEQLAGKTEKDIEEMAEEAMSEVLPSNVYQNYEDKAEDHKSSAYSFLIIGGIGLAVVILSWFELIPFSFGGSGNIFTHGILFAFFVIFIVPEKVFEDIPVIASSKVSNPLSFKPFIKVISLDFAKNDTSKIEGLLIGLYVIFLYSM